MVPICSVGEGGGVEGFSEEDMNNAKVDQITRSQYVGPLNLQNFL